MLLTRYMRSQMIVCITRVKRKDHKLRLLRKAIALKHPYEFEWTISAHRKIQRRQTAQTALEPPCIGVVQSTPVRGERAAKNDNVGRAHAWSVPEPSFIGV